MKPKIFQIAETMGFDLDCEDCVIELCGLLVKAFTGAIDAHDSVLASEYAQAMQQVGRIAQRLEAEREAEEEADEFEDWVMSIPLNGYHA